MSWETYGSFVVVALVLIVGAGAGLRRRPAQLAGAGRCLGRGRGRVAGSDAVQGVVGAVGLGAVPAREEPGRAG